jgi:hypothetical protein
VFTILGAVGSALAAGVAAFAVWHAAHTVKRERRIDFELGLLKELADLIVRDEAFEDERDEQGRKVKRPHERERGQAYVRAVMLDERDVPALYQALKITPETPERQAAWEAAVRAFGGITWGLLDEVDAAIRKRLHDRGERRDGKRRATAGR